MQAGFLLPSEPRLRRYQVNFAQVEQLSRARGWFLIPKGRSTSRYLSTRWRFGSLSSRGGGGLKLARKSSERQGRRENRRFGARERKPNRFVSEKLCRSITKSNCLLRTSLTT